MRLTALMVVVVAVLSAGCTDVRESLTGPSAIGGSPTTEQLRQSPVEILDEVCTSALLERVCRS